MFRSALSKIKIALDDATDIVSSAVQVSDNQIKKLERSNDPILDFDLLETDINKIKSNYQKDGYTPLGCDLEISKLENSYIINITAYYKDPKIKKADEAIFKAVYKREFAEYKNAPSDIDAELIKSQHIKLWLPN